MKFQFNKLTSSGLVWLWLTMLIIAIDRFSKVWVMDHLLSYTPHPITPFFNLTLAYNTGAAFSFLNTASGWQTWFFVGLALIISLVVLIWLSRLSWRECWLNLALSLVLAGALGNAWDRLTYGFVVDFLDFHLGNWHFAIFNIADSGICIGAGMLMLNWWFVRK